MKFLHTITLIFSLAPFSSIFSQEWTTIHNFGWTCKGIMLINEEEGWAANAVYSGPPLQAKHTIDGGYNWDALDTGLPEGADGNMRRVATPDSVDIFMIGNDGQLIHNGGDDTWDLIDLGDDPLWTIHFPTSEVGYIGSSNGALFKSTNAGANWENIGFDPAPTAAINLVYFINADKGFVYTYGAGIYQTFNGGDSWEYYDFGQPAGVFANGIRDMHFVNENLGFAVGLNNYVLRTQDGGDSWEFIDSGVDATLQGVDFANENFGFACGWFGTTIRSIDGGETWQPVATDVENADELYHDIDFYGTHGLMTTNSGYVLAFDLEEISGCTDPEACNFDPLATTDDDSCTYLDVFSITGFISVEPGSLENYFYPTTDGSTYEWTVINGTVINGQGTGFVTIEWGDAGFGTVYVVETSAEGCEGPVAGLEVTVGTVGVDVNHLQNLTITPNPAVNYILVTGLDAESADNIRVTNLHGQLIENLRISSSGDGLFIDVSDWDSGPYLLLGENGQRLLFVVQ